MRRSSSSVHLGMLATVSIIVSAVAWGAEVRTAIADEPMPVPPGVFKGVEVVEKLGAQAPLDARFRDHTGKDVTLANVVRGDLPVLVTFNYSSCPQLCDLQLNGLVNALATVRLVPGKQFRLVTVILAPAETPERAAKTRAHHVEKLRSLGGDVGRDGGVDGWTFLVSRDGKDEHAIKAVSGAVGFGYRYDARQDEYAHPATLVALSASGVVTRYVHGITPVGVDLEQTIVKAGLAEQSASSGFVMSCFHWDPDGRAAWGRKLMRYGAFSFASVLIAVFAIIWWRRTRHPSGVPS
jgi:protein SCO1/2